MRMLRAFGVLTAAFLPIAFLAVAFLTVLGCERAKAVTVEYTLTFEGTAGNRAGGTGILLLEEPIPLESFSESSYGDLLSLTANIGGRTYNFAPSSVEVDLGTNQTFHGITGSSAPGVIGSNGLIGTLVLGGFGFWIINPGGPHLDVGRFTIGQGVTRESPGSKGLQAPSPK